MRKIVRFMAGAFVFIALVLPLNQGFPGCGADILLPVARGMNFNDIYKKFDSEPLPVVGTTATYKKNKFELDPPCFGIIETDTYGKCDGIDVLLHKGGSRSVNTFFDKSCQREGGEYYLVDFIAGYLLINQWFSDDSNSQFIHCLYHDPERTISLGFIDYKRGSEDNVKAIEFARSFGVGKPVVLDVAEKAAALAGFDISGVYGSLLSKGMEVLMERSPRK